MIKNWLSAFLMPLLRCSLDFVDDEMKKMNVKNKLLPSILGVIFLSCAVYISYQDNPETPTEIDVLLDLMAELEEKVRPLTHTKNLASDPFKDKTPHQIDLMFKLKGYKLVGTSPVEGKGFYLHEQTGISFGIVPPKHYVVMTSKDGLRHKIYKMQEK